MGAGLHTGIKATMQSAYIFLWVKDSTFIVVGAGLHMRAQYAKTEVVETTALFDIIIDDNTLNEKTKRLYTLMFKHATVESITD